jgi:outer membrane lipoprotein-sorting protein
MRNLLKSGLALFALMFLFNAFAVTEANAQRRPQDEALWRMNEHNKGLEYLKANVKMEKYQSQLGETDTSEGNVYYATQKKGNPYVRIDWSKPRAESLAVVGKQYMLYQPSLKQAIKGNVDQAKGSGKANNALAFLNMSKAQLQANYTVRYVGQENVNGVKETWHLELTPKMKSSYKVADIWVDKDGMPIMAKVTETNNDTTTVFLSRIIKNEEIPGSMFEINPPQGTKIIKG